MNKSNFVKSKERKNRIKGQTIKGLILSSIFLFTFLFLISFSSATYSFVRTETSHYISVSNEGKSGSAIGFKNITNYFKANPISYNLTFPIKGDIAENSSAWSVLTGNVTNVIGNNTINITGNFSIEATKNGTGNFSLRWNSTHDGYSSGFNAGMAEKIIFYVRVSNSSTKLSSITIRSSNYGDGYPVVFTNKSNLWSFPADTWTRVEINIREDFTSHSYRSPWTSIQRIFMNFSGGISGDKVFVDGLRLEIEDPNTEAQIVSDEMKNAN